MAVLAPLELREKMNRLFERQAVELTFITQDDVDRAYTRRDPKRMTETLDVFSLYAQHHDLLGWNDPEIAAQREAQERSEALAGDEDDLQDEAPVSPAAPTVKIGRNQRCPCGSGAKYKKCCLGVSSEAVLSRMLASLSAATTIDQLKADITAALGADAWVRPTTVLQRVLRTQGGEATEAAFDSSEQAEFFLAHFMWLWNHLASQRSPEPVSETESPREP